jgi:hypothetical protein
MAQLPSSYYKLSWQEVTESRGPGRKTRLIGQESFCPSRRADLMLRAEELLDQGYRVSLIPPNGPPLDVMALPASAEIIPITARAA